MSPNSKGFTLAELMVTCALFSIVLLALVGITSSMVRHLGDRKRIVQSESRFALRSITRDLAQVVLIESPDYGAEAASVVAGLGTLDMSVDPPGPQECVSFCLDADRILRRLATTWPCSGACASAGAVQGVMPLTSLIFRRAADRPGLVTVDLAAGSGTSAVALHAEIQTLTAEP